MAGGRDTHKPGRPIKGKPPPAGLVWSLGGRGQFLRVYGRLLFPDIPVVQVVVFLCQDFLRVIGYAIVDDGDGNDF